jgi:hypothetical protein
MRLLFNYVFIFTLLVMSVLVLTDTDLIKKEGVVSSKMEGGLFIWKDKLYRLEVDRDDYSYTSLVIKNHDTNEEIFRFANNYGLASIMVYQNKIICIATKDWIQKGESKSKIKLFILDSPNSIEMSYVIKEAPRDELYFNTSIDYDDENKEFVIAYEFRKIKAYWDPFSIKFMTSKKLDDWQDKGSVMYPNKYAACPTVRKYGEYYYIWYLNNQGNIYYTVLSRSKDLKTFEDSKIKFLYPSPHEGINNSDFDIIQYEDKSIMLYADGDQKIYANIKVAQSNYSVSAIKST